MYWLLNSSVQSFCTYANLLTSSELDTILPDLLLPRHWAEYPGFNYKVKLCIRTKDLEFSVSNPKKGVFENHTDLARATSECEYVFSDVRGYPIPFGPGK